MWTTLLDLVLPRTCPGCGAAVPWCASCAAVLGGRPRRVLPPPTDDASDVPPAYALTRYRGPVRAAVLAAKEHGRRDLPAVLGDALGAALVRLTAVSVVLAPLWLVPAPTRPAAARRRGGDPMTAMARAAATVAVAAGLPSGVAPCLSTGRGARDSVGLDAAARRANLQGRVRWHGRAAPPSGAPVVLLDDVLTTGATAAAAAAVLHRRGHPVQAVLTLAAVPPMAR
ncbi:ComF family protein [Nakamurella deserti]|uniref:ComF family protein n=1 Tax=Nakamurella deserti TaxID=2164074 RepID=UPI001300B045|nr:ComF family protein [Nakamurella deserti]